MINGAATGAITATGRARDGSPTTAANAAGNPYRRRAASVASPPVSPRLHPAGLDSPRGSAGGLTPRGGKGAGGKGGNNNAHSVSALELLAGGDDGPLSSLSAGQSQQQQQREGSPSSCSAASGGGGGRRRAYSESVRPTALAGGGTLITVDHSQLISEDDCRALLETLMPYAPGAITPHQIVDGVLNSAELLNDRIGELEAELKAKTGLLTAAKKDVALFQQRLRRVEAEKEAAAKAGPQRAGVNPKERRELYAASQGQLALKGELRSAQQALAETRARLEASEREIEEGKELMLRLIQE